MSRELEMRVYRWMGGLGGMGWDGRVGLGRMGQRVRGMEAVCVCTYRARGGSGVEEREGGYISASEPKPFPSCGFMVY